MRRVPLALACVLLLGGCTNPDARRKASAAKSASSPQNAGELEAPAPPAAQVQHPLAVKATPSGALRAFAELYVNWSYRTLTEHQRRLAAMSVGAARLSERQAAASSERDSTIARGHIYNRGQIVGVAAELTEAGSWVIVTREQTGGNAQYEGLPASYHVTIAKLAQVPGGYVVEQWLPQS